MLLVELCLQGLSLVTPKASESTIRSDLQPIHNLSGTLFPYPRQGLYQVDHLDVGDNVICRAQVKSFRQRELTILDLLLEIGTFAPSLSCSLPR